MSLHTPSLEGKRVAVTGGLGALGQVLGRALSERGASVALIDKAPAPEAAPAHQVVIGAADLSSAEGAQRALAEVVARLGGLDALVNVAGGFRWETVAQGSVDTWDLLYGMNVRTALLASQAALPHLLHSRQGRIVNLGAAAALQASLGMGAYAASKAAVARLTEALAEELKDQGVTVNAVLPSIIDTPANRQDMPDADASRWVRPAELAEVIAFLLGDGASAVTGALIPVRGRV